MRNAVLFFMLVCGGAAAQTSAIEGIALDSVTHQPVPGVHISLLPPLVDGVPSEVSYGAMSQRDGHFSIANLPPSIYAVLASRAGYVRMPGASEQVELTPGDNKTGFTIEMTPRATIAGRVLDEYGDPVDKLQVEAIPAGSGTQARPGMSSMTDERGQFRMLGAPGKYYVRADVFTRQTPLKEMRSDGREPAVYGTTYYPASLSKDRASQVDVAAGRDLTGVDIVLAQSRSFTISGHVTGMPLHTAQDGSFAAVVVSPLSNISPGGLGWQPVNPANDGAFSLTGFAPGRYRLTGRLEGTHTMLSAPLEVTVDNADIDSVVLKLGTGETVAGAVEITNAGSKATPVPKIGVRLDARDHFVTAETGANGAFHFDQVFPQKYRVSVQPLPEDAWLRSIQLNDHDVSGGELDLSQGASGARVRITLSPGAGRIEGRVVGDDGEPSRLEAHIVILSRGQGEIDRANLKMIQGGERFQFTSLAPGKYRLLAIGAAQAGNGTDTITASLSKAVEVEIHEGDRLTRDIKVTPLESSDAAQ